MVHMDFSAILTAATTLCGVIWLIDKVLFKAKRIARATASGIDAHDPKLVEFAISFFPVLFAVLILRSFLAEPFRIPSGSMKPTLFEGDFILVNKFTYGLRLPVTGTKIWSMNEPKRGDVMVFRYPKDTKLDFIKRVVGLPGDKIRYKDKVLYINGKKMEQTFVEKTYDIELSGMSYPVEKKVEALNGMKHAVFLQTQRHATDTQEVTVPEGMYFVSGDNRDNSEDSRVWGFVPENLIIGKAFFVWLSWDALNKDVRWKRMGKQID